MNPKDTKALVDLNKAHAALMGVNANTPEGVAVVARLLKDVRDKQMDICQRADAAAARYRKKGS